MGRIIQVCNCSKCNVFARFMEEFMRDNASLIIGKIVGLTPLLIGWKPTPLLIEWRTPLDCFLANLSLPRLVLPSLRRPNARQRIDIVLLQMQLLFFRKMYFLTTRNDMSGKYGCQRWSNTIYTGKSVVSGAGVRRVYKTDPILFKSYEN
jgi:hypothetical protein